MVLPEIHVPLKGGAMKCLEVVSFRNIFLPLTLGPSSGGRRRYIENSISPQTAQITNKEMAIPAQFF